jgi:hypothetical protein
MIEVGFCSDVLGFNSEPNKELRFTPPLASRWVGVIRAAGGAAAAKRGKTKSLRFWHRTKGAGLAKHSLVISAKGATKEGGTRAPYPLCNGPTERPMAKHGTFLGGIE